MADPKPAEAAAATAQGPKEKKPILLYAVVAINMIVVGAVGFMVWKSQKKADATPSVEHVVQGEHETDKKEEQEKKDLVGKIIPLETFVVNLGGDKGRRILKVNMELEVETEEVFSEVDKRKAQIRDIVITLLTSKDYSAIASVEGKNALRDEIKGNLNNFLSTGQIKNIFFTDFIYN